MGDAVTEWAFAAGWSVVRRLPEPFAYRTFDLVADQLWRRRGRGVMQLERNLARVHPELDEAALRELSRAGMRSYLRYWCDAFRLPTWSRARINTFATERADLIDSALEGGRGVILVVPHSGNWDHAGAWMCMRYGGLTTVAERLEPEGLFQRFLAYREALGMEVLALGDSDLMQVLARRLRENRILALVGDRDLGGGGVEVDFFGERASMPGGAAALSLMTGAPMMAVSLWYTPQGAAARVHAVIDPPPHGDRAEKVRAMTQQLATAWEPGIRERSADWHMMQRLWLADVPERQPVTP